jgi:hypothetical protein
MQPMPPPPLTICQPVRECACSQLLQLNTCAHALLNTKRKDLTHSQHTHTMRTQHLRQQQQQEHQQQQQHSRQAETT